MDNGTDASRPAVMDNAAAAGILLDAAPFACCLWDKTYTMTACNGAAPRSAGLATKREYIERFPGLSPERQDCGTESAEKMRRLVKAAFENGSSAGGWTFLAPDGSPVPSELTFTRVPCGGDTAVAMYSRDLRAQQKMTAVLEQRDTLLATVTRAASVLLGGAGSGGIDAAFQESMELLGRCVKADQVHIIQNETVRGELYAVCKYAWVDTGIKDTASDMVGKLFPYSIAPEWKDHFQRGECVNGPVKDLAVSLKVFFASFPVKIQSLLVIPVFTVGKFWGLVSFSDSIGERVYGETEIGILRSASLMMVSAVDRGIQDAAIKDAHIRTRLLTDATPFGFNLWDRKLRNTETNDTSVKLFGLKNQKEYLERYLDLAPEYQDDGSPSKEKAVRLIREAFASGYSQFEWMHQHTDGTLIPTEVTLVRLPYGDDYMVAGYVRDLRGYKKMMATIEQRDLLLQIVNQVIDILLRAEPSAFSGTLRVCMGMMTRAIGADRMYIFKNSRRGKKLFSTCVCEWAEGAAPFKGTPAAVNLPYGESIPEVEEAFLRGESVHRTAGEFPDPDRNWLLGRGALSVLLIPVFIENEFWGFTGFDNCKTGKLFTGSQESIMRSGSFLIVNALLRNESMLRIRETSAKLEKALAAAKEANGAKSNFLAHMSHEIRTPLNAVIGFSELILGDGKLDAETEADLEKIYSAGSTILSIVNDILDISKIESGKFGIYPVQYDTPSLINDTVILNIVRIGEKPVTFKLHVDKDMPVKLSGDDIRVKQIFNNLLSNAFKYTEKGTVEWRIGFEKEGGKGWIVSSVADTGAGMKPDALKKLFADYNQVDAAANRKVEGTGLGLAITKRLVEMMGGKIAVESEYGKGTTFRVRLRQEVVSATPIGEEVAANLMGLRYTLSKRAGKHRQARINLSYAHVLVVDDMVTNLEVVRGILKPYKIKTDFATSGQQAVNMIRGEKPRYNAVFMDHMMPGMDGIEAVRIIREEIGTDYARGIPIIALTANAIAGNDEMFLRKGFQDFVSKPIDITKLDAVLHRWVRDKEREKEHALSGGADSNAAGSGSAASGAVVSNAAPPPAGSGAAVTGTAPPPSGGIQVDGVDKEQALENFGGDEGILIDVLRSYAESTPPLLEKLTGYLAAGNLADYAVTVHGIKGAGYSVSAVQAGDAAKALELAAKAGDAGAVKAGHPAFVKLMETLLDGINRALDGSAAP